MGRSFSPVGTSQSKLMVIVKTPRNVPAAMYISHHSFLLLLILYSPESIPSLDVSFSSVAEKRPTFGDPAPVHMETL